MSYILPIIEITAKQTIEAFMKVEGDYDFKLLFIAQYIECLQKELEILKQKKEQVKISSN